MSPYPTKTSTPKDSKKRSTCSGNAPPPLMGNFSFSPHNCLRIFGHKKIVDNLCRGYRPITEPSKGILDLKVV